VPKALKERKTEQSPEGCLLAQTTPSVPSRTRPSDYLPKEEKLEAMAPQMIGEGEGAMVVPNDEHVDQILKAAKELF
jgi:hypothetical protein